MFIRLIGTEGKLQLQAGRVGGKCWMWRPLLGRARSDRRAAPKPLQFWGLWGVDVKYPQRQMSFIKEDYSLRVGWLNAPPARTHRLLDDAGDHRVGKIQVFRSLRHFTDRSGKLRARPGDNLHTAGGSLVWAVNTPQLGGIPTRRMEVARAS